MKIVCFGEVLWDVLPRGIFLGGAPLNVAYHFARHGVRAVPVSTVGRDLLGDEALRRIGGWKVDTSAIGRVRTRATGIVRAVLDRNGAARYDIARDAAWDRIEVSDHLLGIAAPAAIVYGTLALRESHNRRALQELFDAWPRAVRVLDLNLRAPFDTREVIRFALGHAQLLKLNDEELARLASNSRSLPIARSARQVAERHGIPRVCVTAGARGAGLWEDGQWCWEKARSVDVRDTVGAGDAFVAALLSTLLPGRLPVATALARACRLGEFVAARDGATPPYRLNHRGVPSDRAR